MSHTVYIAIGSNLGSPIEQAKLAISALEMIPNTTLVKVSSLYTSKPMGPQEQPEYVNAVAEINTELSPLELLDQTQKIEQQQGRVRKAERWGPRTLDLDMLLYDQQIIEDERLTVPHYGMKLREFVLYPLSEIASDLILPDNVHLSELLKQIPLNGLTKLESH
ncbi:2-amino-4-hydroxy-6-hydroxymethyldihydropteridine diphosphokinase [Vibrio sp. SS-MA-C1-2]|uniref:2-amino-4-hydroxy-6- hydroxymethyldihydropteridine diphosphokinase n=1 Tax=Vibrio sp. SS-MA-C1-2 TaxID=2908646 RepID=UPI001F2BD8CA|nr:2-amino-4-hydroxy-6-hydroxymethyldihydropteridine diphosphokinase [Vibrio sp. SS-MA-C1-2]UJF19641.1 2-amino-4-hydroxy-6-hydroxymethyldihydropteridine diphosphokinase [Vibrio sp. SS-MA-C1-2]